MPRTLHVFDLQIERSLQLSFTQSISEEDDLVGQTSFVFQKMNLDHLGLVVDHLDASCETRGTESARTKVESTDIEEDCSPS